ncbi:hypothetical protein [Actinomadura hibisca]|uniref:hypothetical protein n=1 Tax=Actinomadura hibisca TaxID=68565 RepID=UPI0008320CC7|nr:hypothetical protein [Actinomadura hibisca]
MRKIMITGMAAALALSLTACNGKSDADSAAPPPSTSAPAPSESTTPSSTTKPDSTPTPESSEAPATEPPSAEPEEGKQVKAATGRLRYLAPGKFIVNGVSFFTSNDTVLYVAGSKCPDGGPPASDVSKCSVDGLDEWAQTAPHNVTVRFSGQTATMIRETQ